MGLVSGLVGAGGGFLIIPALVLFTGLDMKKAVGTSLFIIAANSLFGFLGDVFHYDIDWLFLLAFSTLSIVGIFIGTALAAKVDGQSLKRGFGWFILAMGLYILLKEIFLS
ncbi:sulfite exporter TauE/SafE family protein [Pontibacter rugosus]